MSYHVVRYDDDYSSLTILKSFDDEKQADDFCYDMGHVYIHAHVDILSDDELAANYN